MTVSQFVPAVILAATGKIYTYTTATETKAAKVLAQANLLIADWQDEPNVDWQSLALPDYNLGTVTAAQTFTLPAAVRKLSGAESDVVRILHTDGSAYTDYDIIDVNKRKQYENGARTFQNNYVTVDGTKLVFQRAFATTDPQYGGTIYGPAYGYAGPGTAPNFLVNDADVIPVDIPNWLVYATAAAYDTPDVTRQNLVPRLEGKANQVMQVMKSNNGGQLTKMTTGRFLVSRTWS
jgi:hypothetical protein